MENIEVIKSPRFLNTKAKIVYDLFDAFVKATLVEDKAIDFSKPVITREDGSLEFITRDEKFSDIISGEFKVQMVKAPHKPVKPSKPKEPKMPEAPKKPAEFKDDEAKAKYEEKVQEYQTRLGKYPERLKKYETAKAAFNPEKYEAQMAEYQAELEKYNAQAAEADEKRNALLQTKGLLYAHVNWLWTLGMNNAKTSCGQENLKALGIEKEEGAAFTGKTGLWKASLGSSQKEQSFICNVLFRYATFNPAIKSLYSTVAQVKENLVDIILKVKRSEKINARHGMLHLCDPNRFAAMYSTEEKVLYVNTHTASLRGFVDPYNKCDVNNILYYKDEKLGYRYPTTDAQVCHLKDSLQ